MRPNPYISSVQTQYANICEVKGLGSQGRCPWPHRQLERCLVCVLSMHTVGGHQPRPGETWSAREGPWTWRVELECLAVYWSLSKPWSASSLTVSVDTGPRLCHLSVSS